MEKQFRLRKNYQFNYVYKHGKSCSDKNVVIVFCNNRNNKPRIGFCVNKKVGNAVKRNLMRRRLKNIVEQVLGRLDQKYNYIFLPRGQVEFAPLKSSVLTLLSKHGLGKEQ